MDPKSTLRAITLELRRELEGTYDAQGNWQPGDLERRLAAIGVRRDRPPVPVDELPHLSADDREARRVVDAFLQSRAEAGQGREAAIAEFGREAAYTWANRLLALRCLEARGLIDEIVLQKDTYGGRSLQHQRLARKEPERCSGEDEGLLAMLFDEFARRAKELPLLFDPRASEVALRPSVAALKRCIALLSGTLAAKGQEAATDEVFTAPDALGWTYQYWNTEEKDRVFEKVGAKQGAKIQGAEIIPATCIYTETYMVRFIVQNSLGAIWMGMHPDSRLYEKWEYYVRNADRTPTSRRPLSDITFLDPACGSGHFLIEAFELFYAMYLAEGAITAPAEICAAILERNLYGIDIDERAVQIAALALVMKAKEKAPDFAPHWVNLVATNIRLPAGGEHLEAFLRKHPEDAPLKPALLAIFEGLVHADELGSLLQIEEPVDRELRQLRDQQLARERKVGAGTLFGPRQEEDWAAWKHDAIERLRQHFGAAAQEADLATAFFGEAASKGLSLVDLLTRRYDVVAANPPYMGDINMGAIVKAHLAKHFPKTSSDLFAAFVERATALTTEVGSTAMVVQRVVLFNADYEYLRRFLVAAAPPSCVAVLGPGAFQDISGEKVNTVLLVQDRNRRGLAGTSRSLFLDLEDAQQKDRELLLICGSTSPPSDRTFKVPIERFGVIPGAPWAYSVPEVTLARFEADPLLSSIATCRSGLSTGDDPRFLRYTWEIVDVGARWRPIVDGGGGTERWWRQPNQLVDAESDFARLRNNLNADGRTRAALRNLEFQGRGGLTYLKNAGKTFAGRLLPEGTMFLDTGRAMCPSPEKQKLLLGLLNTAHVSELMCRIGGGGSFVNADIERIPVPIHSLERIDIDALVDEAISLRRELVTFDLAPGRRETEAGRSLKHYLIAVRDRIVALSASLVDAEGRIESAIREAYDEPANGKAGHALSSEPPPTLEELAAALFERYVLDLLGDRQISEGKRHTGLIDADGIIPIVEGTGEDTLLARVRARLAGDFGPDSAGAIERDFQQMVGKLLPEWLGADFFKRHISQFMKRPIAWQVESTPAASGKRRGRALGRKRPAFSCIVLYRRLDADLLPKLRTQYVGPMRTRLQIELTGLERLKDRAVDHDARRFELEGLLEELKAFDGRLEQVIADGFASSALDAVAAKEPLDKWSSRDGHVPAPASRDAFLGQERRYAPDLNDGVRVNIAPLQRAGLLAADVLAAKDVEKAITDRTEWRADERRWCREGKLPRPGWWTHEETT